MDVRNVKSAIRVFDVLELFERERRPMRVGEIVSLLDMPQSSVSMLLRTMAVRGYADYDAREHTYSPSVRVAFLCGWTVLKDARSISVHDVIRTLVRQTGETVLLARQSGIQLQYLTVVDAPHASCRSVAPGTTRPMHMTSIGIMLMSRMEDSEISRLILRYNAERQTGAPPANLRQVMGEVQRARHKGYYESANLATSGAGVIATVMAKPIRGRWMGIGVGAHIAHLHEQREKLVAAVLNAARED